MAIFNLAYRALKNLSYNPTEVLVRDATANDPDDPLTDLVAELARRTYTHMGLVELMSVLDRRLNDRTRQWRYAYRSLYVVQRLLVAESQPVAEYFHKNVYLIKTLREFYLVDEAGRDQGALGTYYLSVVVYSR